MPARTLLNRPSIKCVHSSYCNTIFTVDHFSKLQFVCAYEITVNFIVHGVCNSVDVLFNCVFIICSFVKYFIFCADEIELVY